MHPQLLSDNMVKLALSLVGACLLAGCNPTTYDVRIDASTMDMQNVSDFVNATSTWMGEAPVTLNVTITREHCSGFGCILFEEVARPDDLGTDIFSQCNTAPGKGNTSAGCTITNPFSDGGAHHVRIVRGLPDGYRQQAMLHELGHAMGLSHVDGHVLMSPVFSMRHHVATIGSEDITCDDVKQWYAVRGRRPPFCDPPE